MRGFPDSPIGGGLIVLLFFVLMLVWFCRKVSVPLVHSVAKFCKNCGESYKLVQSIFYRKGVLLALYVLRGSTIRYIYIYIEMTGMYVYAKCIIGHPILSVFLLRIRTYLTR